MMVLVIGAAGLYFPLNRNLTGGVSLSTSLDERIPIWSVWVIPYLLCLPLWVGGLIWAALKMDEQLFRSFICACFFILLSAALLYYFFPTYIKRPTLTKGNWTMRVLQLVYQNDGVYNAFPSGHVSHTSLICLFCSHLYPGLSWLWISIVAVVILSTLFTRQHNLADPLGGLAIAWVGYRLGLYLYS
jgi:membrane-associated phospholipid phosphatase